MRYFVTFVLVVAAPPCLSEDNHVRNVEVNTCQIDGPIDHNHCTTRQFQHMTFCHEGTWFVFYSDGKDFRYQASVDAGNTCGTCSKQGF